MIIIQALQLAAGMFWQVAWSLVLGFFLSAAIQTLVSKERMTAQLGRNGVREMFLDLIIREDLKEGPVSIPDEQKQEIKDEVAVN